MGAEAVLIHRYENRGLTLVDGGYIIVGRDVTAARQCKLSPPLATS